MKVSMYLVDRCKTFEKLIDFFLSKKTNYCTTLDEKHTIFLSQIDFWDWEIENLIFSFSNFGDRSEVWTSSSAMIEKLSHHGIAIKNSVFDGLDWKRQHRERVVGQSEEPIDVLNSVIKKWNKLLLVCEGLMVNEKLIAMGIDLLPDLSKYKKDEYKKIRQD